MGYVLYLRKSRADLEAEARGEGETLARHEKTLLELAKKLNLNVVDIYREIVSGETIASRPVMQKLLSEVEQGAWDGVLVMEIERLARGDTIDQGIVAQAFKYSETKIITPMKIYDPDNEYDEEYFEFGLFMSRREYKTTNRRLQHGRIASIREGKYVGNIAPYGYRRVKLKNEKGFTLEPIKEQADVVRLIFDLYVNGEKTENGMQRLGMSLIARKLNSLGIKPLKNEVWVSATIRDMLSNPVYAGKIRWKHRAVKKKVIDGEVVKQRPINDDYLVVDGLHEPIVDIETFEKAQNITKNNKKTPVGIREIKNPLAGLVRCGKCGRAMLRRPYDNYPDTLICTTPNCTTVSAKLEDVEDGILNVLSKWLKKYKTTIKADKRDSTLQISVLNNQLKAIQTNIKELKQQMDKIYEMLEKNIYTTDVFLERSKAVSDKLKLEERRKEQVLNEINKENEARHNYNELIPIVEDVLSIYKTLPNGNAKNEVLKRVIKEVIYTKERSGSFKNIDPKDFKLKVYPVLPKS